MSAPEHLLLVGGGGGIGAALRAELARRWPQTNITITSRPGQAAESANSIDLDFTSHRSIEAAAEAVQARAPRFDAVIIASGWLHDAQHQPEKSVRSLSMSAFERAYAINAAGPLTLLAALLPALRAPTGTPRTRIMVLSAKVGSIGDNSLGGWHSYRMAKAALNMGVRNLGIEFARNARSPLIAAVHPGTTETPLSAPFAKRGLPVMRAATTAARLLDFLSAMTDDHQGGFFHWDGSPLPP